MQKQLIGFERQLNASIGYLELGMLEDSWNELEGIDPIHSAIPDVLRVRAKLLIAMRRWESALEIANALCAAFPQTFEPFFDAAFCLHELRRTAEAVKKLGAGPPSKAGEWVYHYNMACYHCALGELDVAVGFLRTALKKRPALHDDALLDVDLVPLRDFISKSRAARIS